MGKWEMPMLMLKEANTREFLQELNLPHKTH